MSQSANKTEERVDHTDDDSSTSSCDSEAGWGFLLGGLSTENMVSANWERNDEDGTSNQKDEPKANNSLKEGSLGGTERREEFQWKESDPPCEFQNYQKLSERAFCLSPNGQIQKPPVTIRDCSLEHKGNVLIATRDISKGSVIFTEKALEAIQVPSPNSQNDSLYSIRGCQNCFCSLEPASCLSPCKDLPLSELWPVPEYDHEPEQHECIVIATDSDAASTMLLHTPSRRVSCPNCNAIFCNKYCAKHHLQTVGDCCKCTRAMKGLVRVTVHSETKMLSQHQKDDGVYCEEEGLDFLVNINPVLVLAAKMFVSQVRRYRADESAPDSLIHALCGQAQDIRALGFECPRVGADDENAETAEKLPLQDEYEAIAEATGLTESERKIDSRFSLNDFHKLVAIAQRNSISLTTGSPFRTYYQAMVRTTGGRGSSKQQKIIPEVARLLGSKDGKLTRDMDRMVEEKCVVKMGGIFTLTAFMNHSCGPNAEIRGQEYVDCNIDIVAKEDIRRGEEICISYLNLGTNPSYSAGARNRRRRELSARYLFHCQCSRCVERAH